MTGRRRNDHPLSSLRGAAFSREELATWRAVAIHVPAPRSQWIASFLAMTGQGRMTGQGCNDRPFRHCEASKAVAIHAHSPVFQEISNSWGLLDLI